MGSLDVEKTMAVAYLTQQYKRTKENLPGTKALTPSLNLMSWNMMPAPNNQGLKNAVVQERRRIQRDVQKLTRHPLFQYARRRVLAAKTVAAVRAFMYAWTGSIYYSTFGGQSNRNATKIQRAFRAWSSRPSKRPRTS